MQDVRELVPQDGETDDEDDITGSAEAAPRHQDHEADTSAGAACSEEE